MTKRYPISRILLAVAVPVALFVSLVTWAFASPVGSSPDDDYHMASIWCGQGDRAGLCEPAGNPLTRRVPAALLESVCYAGKSAHDGACAVPASNVLVPTNRGNFHDHGYPGFYYAVMSVFASPNISVSILAIRVFNALIFTAAVTGLFFALRRGQRGPLLWGTLMTSVPLGMFIIPSVNPSSWAVISASVLWLSTHAFLRELTHRRILFGSIAVISAVMGAGARSDAAAYNCVALLIACILAFERTRRYAISLILPIALVIVSAAFFLTSGQSGIVVPITSNGGQSIDQFLQLLRFNVAGLPQLWTGSLGSWPLGWFDTTLPIVVPTAMCAVYAGIAFWGLRRLRWRKSASLVIAVIALIMVPLYVLMHDRVLVGEYVQPRYVLPLVVLFAGLVLFDFKRDDLRLSTVQLIVAGALVALANGWSLYVNIRRYVTGVNYQAFSLSSHAAWWWNIPVSPMFMWIIGAAAYVAVVAGMIIYARARPGAADLAAPAPGI